MGAARARGRVGGRPKGLTKKSKELLLNDVITLVFDNFHSNDSRKKDQLLKKLTLIANGELKTSTV
jgi:hypothetical protein